MWDSSGQNRVSFIDGFISAKRDTLYVTNMLSIGCVRGDSYQFLNEMKQPCSRDGSGAYPTKISYSWLGKNYTDCPKPLDLGKCSPQDFYFPLHH